VKPLALRPDPAGPRRGRPFSFDELVGFDLENLIGVACALNIVAKTSKKGKVFSNIAGIMPLPKSMTKIEPRDYVRTKDRPTVAATPAEPMPPFGEDDEPPF